MDERRKGHGEEGRVGPVCGQVRMGGNADGTDAEKPAARNVRCLGKG